MFDRLIAPLTVKFAAEGRNNIKHFTTMKMLIWTLLAAFEKMLLSAIR